MKWQSAGIARSKNTLKFRSESEVWVKMFPKSADPWAYSPLSVWNEEGKNNRESIPFTN